MLLKCAFVGSMIASWNGLFLAEVTRVSVSTDVGESTAASTFFTFISYMLAPPIFGIVSYNLGYQSAFILVGGLAALSAAAMLGCSAWHCKRRLPKVPKISSEAPVSQTHAPMQN